MESIRSDQLCLRPWSASDTDAFVAAVRESVASVGRWMDWCHAAYSAEEATHWFARCAAARTERSAFEFGIFASDGVELLGGVGLNQINAQNNFCNLGYWVRASRQRQGIAARAVDMLAGYGFAELGLTRIEIVVAEGNAASQGVAEKVGAVYEGRARNRLTVAGRPVAAFMYSLIP